MYRTALTYICCFTLLLYVIFVIDSIDSISISVIDSGAAVGRVVVNWATSQESAAEPTMAARDGR